MKEKIDEAVKLINEIKADEESRRSDLKEKVLDKLNDSDDNYFLIIKHDVGGKWQVYGMRCDTIDECHIKCQDLIDDDLYEEHFILHKDEINQIIYALNNEVVRQNGD